MTNEMLEMCEVLIKERDQARVEVERLNQMLTTRRTAMNYQDMPALGAQLGGGAFAGVTTKKDGTHCAVILLPEQAEDLTWEKAMSWAEKLGGELPSRLIAALLSANVKSQLKPKWHWTSDQCDASYAWACYFSGGVHYNGYLKSYEGYAAAVRLIPIGEQT